MNIKSKITREFLRQYLYVRTYGVYMNGAVAHLGRAKAVGNAFSYLSRMYTFPYSYSSGYLSALVQCNMDRLPQIIDEAITTIANYNSHNGVYKVGGPGPGIPTVMGDTYIDGVAVERGQTYAYTINIADARAKPIDVPTFPMDLVTNYEPESHIT